MALNSYVKFQRGTPAEYELLKKRSLIEDNALYFLYESGATQGTLYLGNILIGNIGAESNVSSLSELKDVLITEIGAQDILMADSEGIWKNVPLSIVLDMIADQKELGFVVDSKAFEFQSVEGVQTLKLLGLEAAPAGASLLKGSNGQVEWSINNIDVVAQEVANLSASIENVQKNIAEQIAAANHLSYKVISSLDEAVEENTVYLMPKEGAEKDSYDEYMFVNGTLELLGAWGINLDGYATTADLEAVQNSVDLLNQNLNQNYLTKNDFTAKVGDLSKLENQNEENPITLVDKINLLSNSIGDLNQLANHSAENPTNIVKEINSLYNLFGSSTAPGIDKVGDLTQLITYEEGKETNVVKEINNIYERLVWQPISIE